MSKVTTTDLEGLAPKFIEAARVGDEYLLRELLLQGVGVNSVDGNGRTALHFAAYAGHANITGILIENNANLDLRDGMNGRTALHFATIQGNVETVAQLIAGGADVKIGDSDSNNILIHAAGKKQKEIVGQLIRTDIDVNARGSNDDTALHLAAEIGDEETIGQLIDAGADVSLKNSDGLTAINYAKDGTASWILLKKAETSKKIVEAIKSLDVEGLYKLITSKYSCINWGDDIELREFINSKDFDIDSTDQNGKTALHQAIERGHKEATEILIKYGADFRYSYGKNMDTALHVAARHGHKEIVDLLIDAGAIINAGNSEGETALMLTAANGGKGADNEDEDRKAADRKAIKALIDAGANVNYVDAKGNSALHHAAKNGCKAMMFVLSKYENVVDFENAEGDTAILIKHAPGSSPGGAYGSQAGGGAVHQK